MSREPKPETIKFEFEHFAWLLGQEIAEGDKTDPSNVGKLHLDYQPALGGYQIQQIVSSDEFYPLFLQKRQSPQAFLDTLYAMNAALTYFKNNQI